MKCWSISHKYKDNRIARRRVKQSRDNPFMNFRKISISKASSLGNTAQKMSSAEAA